MVGVDTLVEDVARWYLLNAPGAPLGETIEEAAPIFSTLSAAIETSRLRRLAGGARGDRPTDCVAEGVPEELARRHAYQPELAHGPDIIAVTQATGRTIEEVASAFFLAGERFHLDWLEQRLVELPDGSRFERWATQAVGDDLMTLRRDIALRVLDSADGRPIPRAMEDYLERRSEPYERLNRLVNSLSAQGESSLAALTVALRQVPRAGRLARARLRAPAQRPRRRRQAAKLRRARRARQGRASRAPAPAAERPARPAATRLRAAEGRRLRSRPRSFAEPGG